MYSGYEIPPYFDSMCAKLTVWALTWEGVIERGRRALNDMLIYGVKTTIPYYLEILKHPDFRNADFNTSFVESHPELINYITKIPPELRAAAISAVIAAHEGI
jgi:pyruvate carboxylase subunit A